MQAVQSLSLIHISSRTAQIIRSVYLGELEASEYGAEMVFSSILSGQGERWQNFGEKPEDFLLSVMLGRELFYNKGQKKAEIDALKAQIDKNNGYLEKNVADIKAWKEVLPIDADSKTGLLLDEATFIYAKRSREKIGEFLQKKGITVSEFGPYFTGFDLLASGIIDEGIETVKTLIHMWEEKGIRKVITPVSYTHLDVYKRQLTGTDCCSGFSEALCRKAGKRRVFLRKRYRLAERI